MIVALRRLEAYEEAAEVAAEAVALRRHGDSPEALALSLYSEGTSLVDLERHDEAVPLLRESAELFLDEEGPTGSPAGIVSPSVSQPGARSFFMSTGRR